MYYILSGSGKTSGRTSSILRGGKEEASDSHAKQRQQSKWFYHFIRARVTASKQTAGSQSSVGQKQNIVIHIATIIIVKVFSCNLKLKTRAVNMCFSCFHGQQPSWRVLIPRREGLFSPLHLLRSPFSRSATAPPAACLQGKHMCNTNNHPITYWRRHLLAVSQIKLLNYIGLVKWNHYFSPSVFISSYKVREHPLQPTSHHRKRSTQSDTALLPSNVYFQQTLTPVSVPSKTGSRTGRHRGSKV